MPTQYLSIVPRPGGGEGCGGVPPGGDWWLIGAMIRGWLAPTSAHIGMREGAPTANPPPLLRHGGGGGNPTARRPRVDRLRRGSGPCSWAWPRLWANSFAKLRPCGPQLVGIESPLPPQPRCENGSPRRGKHEPRPQTRAITPCPGGPPPRRRRWRRLAWENRSRIASCARRSRRGHGSTPGAPPDLARRAQSRLLLLPA